MLLKYKTLIFSKKQNSGTSFKKQKNFKKVSFSTFYLLILRSINIEMKTELENESQFN